MIVHQLLLLLLTGLVLRVVQGAPWKSQFISTPTANRQRPKQRLPWHASKSKLAFANGLAVNPRNVAESVHPSVALVTPIGVRNITARGSGFCVDFCQDDNHHYLYLLTAAHVALPGCSLEIRFPNTNMTRTATVVGRNVNADLALIRTEKGSNDSNVLKFYNASDKPAVGTFVFANGYPGGISGGLAMTMGIICAHAQGLSFADMSSSQNATTGITTSYVVTDAAMAGGMSGGPLVDKDGHVLGVNALIRPDLRALGNYAIDASECLSFLEELRGRKVGGGVELYRVVLFNDPMNTRARVVSILGTVGKLDESDANKVMMQAHTSGRGTVSEYPGTVEGRVEADNLCSALREADVLCEVELVQ